MTYLPLAARICLALIFLNSGIKHLIGFQSFVPAIAGKGLPLPQVLAVGAIVLLLLGSASLILGYQTKVGALLLILFLIPTTLSFHPIATDTTGFLKNLALVGGLLMMMTYGPGLISVDGRHHA